MNYESLRPYILGGIIALTVTGFGGLGYWYYTSYTPSVTVSIQTTERQPWMTVFSHGTFGTMRGLLNVFDVMKDNVDQTRYKKLTSHMRYDPYFYQMQPMQAPGLKSFEPTFDIKGKEDTKFAAHPVAKAYEEVTEHIIPEKEANKYYTFGWSGLISQLRRRKEAVRFYNMLQKELATQKEANIAAGISASIAQPKLRILAHSHGGNVALNLAAVNEVRELESPPVRENFETDDHFEAIRLMYELIESLPDKQEASKNKHQKKWDYQPEGEKVFIDELILLGTPVQPETSAFFLSNTFKRLALVYSDNDMVQRMDWVSTKRYYSDQRLDISNEKAQKCGLTQIKLSINKDIQHPEKEAEEKLEKPSVMSTKFWKSFFTGKQKDTDPNHKELWFMSWRTDGNEDKGAQKYIKPYPFAVFMPIIKQLWESHDDKRDIDVNITFGDEHIEFGLYPHEQTEKVCAVNFPKYKFAQLQEEAKLWRPENLTPKNQMGIIQQYSALIDSGQSSL